ncbi:MAG TPA: LacI family DNA-binding transcriptional regulator [Chthoniobacteraceae bacterium]|nr:LacI family DNA-binding transcriptional regulator [Chthoniobacteraceae bacterium]
MPITQRQIALEAKVSRSTVAAVLSNTQRERFSKEVQERVLATARKHGYRPNRYAQVMNHGKSGYIGILGFGTHNSLSYRKLGFATELFRRLEYDWIVHEAGWYAADEDDVCDLLVQKMIDARVEGVLLIYPPRRFTQGHLERLRKARIPVVGVANEHLADLPSFVSDRSWGYHFLTRHLLSLGHRRLALLYSNPACLEAFSQALGETPEMAVKARDFLTPEMQMLPVEQLTYLPGWLGMRHLLEQPERPDAVVCANDAWALGALKACEEAGLRVPRDIALTGFDNDPAGAFGTVPLTTIDHPVKETAQQAAEFLLNIIRNQPQPCEQRFVIRGTPIIRRSCGASDG